MPVTFLNMGKLKTVNEDRTKNSISNVSCFEAFAVRKDHQDYTASKTVTVQPFSQSSTLVEAYRPIFETLHFLGSSGFCYPKAGQKIGDDRIPVAVQFKPGYLYYISKTITVIHFVYFLVRFYNMIQCEELKCTNGKGVYLLVIACYILALGMLTIVNFWFHWKREEICTFFEKFSQLDNQICDETARKSYIIRHKKICFRVMFYFPFVTIISWILIILNHINHPHFMSHLTSVFFTPEDTFMSTNWHIFVTCLSFSIEICFVLYFYLGMYQFLFLSIIFGRSFKWCLEAITECKSSPEEFLDMFQQKKGNKSELRLHVERSVEKFEEARNTMAEYNGIFSTLQLFCKAMYILQITISAYIPIQRVMILQFPSLQIFVMIIIHFVLQAVMLLYEMGRVFKASSQFREVWIRNLVASIRIKKHSQFLGDGQEHDDTDLMENEILKLKFMLESCSPFGFEFGGCYVANTSTILTVFSILTSYLIIMLQLQI